MSKPHVAQQSVLMDVEPDAAGPGQAKAPVDKTFRRYDQDQPMLLAPDSLWRIGLSSVVETLRLTTSGHGPLMAV